jgi:FAD/FMN-containing dehydrogenase
VDDVVRAVKVARQRGLPIAVRSGGHSMAGFSTTDGGLLVDLSLMDSLSIDPDRRVATVEPGLTWGAYSERANSYGLATPAGDNATVGVGGLTLGGGIGWLARKHGMTIDHLLSAQVVTAEGQVLNVSETENPDLFWAIRGGGGNFGIVTRFEFGLVPVGKVVAGMLVLPAEPDVLVAFARAAAEAPDELTTISEVMKTPPIPFLSHDLYGKLNVLAAFCYAGDWEDMESVEKALEPLRSAGPVLGEMVAPMPYPGVFKFTEEGSVRGPYSVRSHFLPALDLDAAEAIVAGAQRGTSPESMVQIRVLGGALARIPDDATAFAHRNATIFVAAINPWLEATPEEEKQHVAWTESVWNDLKPKATGAYASFQGDEGNDCVNQAYPPPTYKRLARIKAQYDPDNLFHANCNIVPQR